MKPHDFFEHIRTIVKTPAIRCRGVMRKHGELIRYVISGGLTTVVDFGVYTILYKLLNVNDILSNAIAWFAAVMFAFVTNKLFVFGSKSLKLSIIVYEFFTFIAARGITGAVYVGGYPLLVRIGMNGYVAKVLLSIFNIIANYIFSKFVTFRKNSS